MSSLGGGVEGEELGLFEHGLRGLLLLGRRIAVLLMGAVPIFSASGVVKKISAPSRL